MRDLTARSFLDPAQLSRSLRCDIGLHSAENATVRYNYGSGTDFIKQAERLVRSNNRGHLDDIDNRPMKDRRLFTFGLRSLLLLTAMLSVFVAIGASLWHQYMRRQPPPIVTALRSSGNELEFLTSDNEGDFARDSNVELIRFRHVTDLSPLRFQHHELDNVAEIECFLETSERLDLNDFVQLKNLRSLTLCDAPHDIDLSPLSRLESLDTLIIISSTINDVAPLEQLSNLRRLEIVYSDVDRLPSPVVFNQLAHVDLSALRIRGTRLSDVAFLASCENLRSLRLSSTAISDLSPLTGLRALQTLDISITSASDLQPLANLGRLRSVNLCGAPVVDLTPLSQLESLEEINIAATQVVDLAALENLRSLKRLNCSSTSVSDLSPLSNSRDLQILNVAMTNVGDISFIEGLSQLKTLVLDASFPSEDQITSFRRKVPDCEVRFEY